MRMRLMMAAIAALSFGGAAQAQQYYYAQPYYAQQPQYAQPQHVQQPRYYAPPPQMVVVAPPQRVQTRGGGFIEAIFGGDDRLRGYAPLPHEQQRQQRPQQQYYAQPQQQQQVYYGAPAPVQQVYASAGPVHRIAPQDIAINPIYERQEVVYHGKEEPGTIVIDTPNKFLYLVEGNGRALRYGIGVGRPGFTWAGTHNVTMKKEWPDWYPPKEMLERQPYLPKHMEGGLNNPLGARALYLGSTLYRIHGSNEPWTIGQNVSSGCIRLRNADVEDLYERVKVGTKVVVM